MYSHTPSLFLIFVVNHRICKCYLLILKNNSYRTNDKSELSAGEQMFDRNKIGTVNLSGVQNRRGVRGGGEGIIDCNST